MPTPIQMPKFGQMTEDSSIVEWRKREGDVVQPGDILFTVETDKSVMEVESFASGTLLKILVQPGHAVPVQSVVGFLGQPGEPIPDVPAAAPTAKPISAPAAPPPTPSAPAPARAEPAPVTAAPAPDVFRISPRAAKLASEAGIRPQSIPGTGPGGRIVERDVRAWLESKGYDKLRISPAALELARHEKLDVLSIEATGEDGRIAVEDVRRAASEKPRPLSRMRQVIAQRLTQSVVTAPHFYVTVEADVTELSALRAELKQRGGAFTLTDFIARAAVLTLKEFPDVNSSTDGKSVRWSSRVHLGLAVSLEQGLVVPVIRNADRLSLEELHRSSRELVQRARDGKLAPDEMTGGTFTISNMGMLDVENFTAIINPGEAAILAVASERQRPVVREGQVVVRSILKMTLSADHRLVDGAMAARFVNGIRKKLESVELWNHLISR